MILFSIYLQSIWLLCGLLVIVPPSLSIRCYRQACEGTECFWENREVECQGEDYDSCGTLTFTTGGSTHNVIKNCTRSAIECNEKATCDRVERAIAKWVQSFSDCSVTCCESDVCNAPSNDDEVATVKTHHHVPGKWRLQYNILQSLGSFFYSFP